MPHDNPLDLTIGTREVTPVATDFTLLLEASSFIRPLPKQRFDSRTIESFERVATSYCNGANLYLPLQKRNDVDVPILVDLWRKSGAVEVVPNLELPDESVKSAIKQVERRFAAYIESFPTAVAEWIAFHFSDKVVQAHLSEGDGEPVLRTSEAARRLVKKYKFSRFENAIYKLESEGLSGPRCFSKLVPSPELPSLLHLAIAYALSVSIRGRHYATELGRLQAAPIYQHHWIRNPALTSDMRGEEFRNTQTDVSGWIPFGMILAKVFDLDKPVIRRDPKRILEIMFELRARSFKLRSELSQLRYFPLAKDISQQEELLLDVLSAVGIEPLFKDSGSADPTDSKHWIANLRNLINAKSLIAFVFEIVAMALPQPRSMRAVEKAIHIQFKRDKFWDRFDDLNVPQALRVRNDAILKRASP